MVNLLLSLVLTFLLVSGVKAQELFFFKEATDTTYYDQGIVDVDNLGESSFEFTHPPGAEQFNDKVPASTVAFRGSTSLRFNYTSNSDGNWKVTIYRNDWSAMDISEMDSLAFFIYAEDGLPAESLPLVGIRAANNSGSGDLNSTLHELSPYNQEVPPEQWVRISMPLDLFFNDDQNSNMDFSSAKGVVFNQSESNGSSRTILVDEIAAFKRLNEIPEIENLTAEGYDSHAELTWNIPAENLLYRIYASYDDGNTFIVRAETTESYYLDFVPDSAGNKNVNYRITTAFQNEESEPVEATAELKDYADDELLDMVQRYTFRYFWEGAHQETGTILERSNGSPSTVASGATGMGLMAMIVAYEREYRPREAILDRILLILDFLENCERHHGAWSHWYNADTGLTQPFSPDDDGGDIVETSFVAAGLIALRNYFTGQDDKSVRIRETATRLWEEIDWNWYRNGQNVLFWHWSPNIGFERNMHVRGWNETLITYIMAASSPTHGITADVYEQGYARNGNMVNPRSFYEHQISLAPDWGGPLFWIHYTHLGIDPRGLRDKYADYWQEHVSTALIHHAYAVDNPLGHANYGENNWGLTASDDPEGYTAHQPVHNDNGTISPTAALASIPYTPGESMMALKYFYRSRGENLFGRYGPYDAFNDNLGWVQDGYIGIDQGPVIIMIENYRTALLWETVMNDPDVKAGLDKLGFEYQITSSVPVPESDEKLMVYPVPANKRVVVSVPEKLKGKKVQIKIFAMDGRLVQAEAIAHSPAQLALNTTQLNNGFYLVHLIGNGSMYKSKLVINR